MALFSALDWPIRLLVAAVVAGGLGAGGYLVARTSGDEEPPAVVVPNATPTATRPAATATRLPVTLTQPPSTPIPPSTTATPLPIDPAQPTPLPPNPTVPNDTRIPISDLPSVSEIRLGSDGRYFIADRGDGCPWYEYLRRTEWDIGVQVYLRTDCPAEFALIYRPGTGEVLAFVS